MVFYRIHFPQTTRIPLICMGFQIPSPRTFRKFLVCTGRASYSCVSGFRLPEGILPGRCSGSRRLHMQLVLFLILMKRNAAA